MTAARHRGVTRRSAAIGIVALAIAVAGCRLRAQDASEPDIARLATQIEQLRSERRDRDAIPLLQSLVRLQEERGTAGDEARADVLDQLGDASFNVRQYRDAADAFERALAIH